MHDLLRLFASARLAGIEGSLGASARRDRLHIWLLSTLERAGAWFEPERSPDSSGGIGHGFPDSVTAEVWIRLEEDHWSPAMNHAASDGDHALVVDTAGSLHWFSELWLEWGHWRELFSLAVASARALGDSRLEAMHLGYLVWAVVLEGRDAEDGLRTAHPAIAAAETSGDHQQRGWANYYLGWMFKAHARLDEGIAACRMREFSAESNLTRWRRTIWCK